MSKLLHHPRRSHPTAFAASPTASDDLAPIKAAYYDALKAQAQSTVASLLQTPGWYPVDASSLGDFPWFWNNAGTFNTATWSWFNNVFQYNDAGYLEAVGDSLTTELYNTYLQITYTLSPDDQNKLNAAVLANQGIANTVVGDFTTMFGPIPPANSGGAIQKLSYVTQQVLSWSTTPGLTLATLRSAQNPMSLLGNRPFGSDQLVEDFMSYLNATNSVATIQNAVATLNAEIAQCALNLSPAPASATPGWMQAAGTDGVVSIVPFLTIDQSTGNIANALGINNAGGGKAFSVGMTVNKLDSNTVSVSASGGIGGQGSIDWFNFSGSVGASYNMFSADETLTSCSVAISYKNVTSATPKLSQSAYQASTGTGWWDPAVIAQAVNNAPGTSGLHFSTPPNYNYGQNGTFGVLSNVIICPCPTFELTYQSTNMTAFNKMFSEKSDWSIGFLGIPLASGSQSYYSSTVSQDTTTGTITVTMSPPQMTTPVSVLDQLAYVIGGQVVWPAGS